MTFENEVMALVDEYADAFHAACRPDGGIQIADGMVAKIKKDAIRTRLRDEWVKGQEKQVHVDRERVAQLIAHRACCGVEHDPDNGKLHGYCVVCGVPWPCEIAAPVPQAGMVMVPREIFDGALNYINHCGSNQIMRGEPHPQQWIVDGLLAASTNAAPQVETASTLGTPAVAAPFFQVQTALVELRQAVTNLERKVDDYLENIK